MFNDRLKLFFVLAAIVILGGLVMSYLVWRSSRSDSGDSQAEANLITKVEMKLTPSQRQKVEADIARYRAMVEKRDTGGEPDMMRTYLALGQAYETAGEFGEARGAYLKASEANPKLSQPWSNLGTLYQSMGSDRLAREALDKAVALDPTVPINWEKLIDFYQHRLRADDNAIGRLFEQSFKATADDFNLHRKYAVYLAAAGSRLDAIAQWDFIVKMNPSDVVAKTELQRLRQGK